MKEWHSDIIAIVLWGYLSAKELRGEDGGQKGQQKHKENQVQQTTNVAKYDHLRNVSKSNVQ